MSNLNILLDIFFFASMLFSVICSNSKHDKYKQAKVWWILGVFFLVLNMIARIILFLQNG